MKNERRQSDQDQIALVEAAKRRVRRMARVIHRRHPEVEEAELFIAGTGAVLKAAQRFDASRGVRFDVFCWKHAFGAMQERVRSARPEVQKALAAVQRSGIDATIDLGDPEGVFLEAEEEPGARVAVACDEVVLAMALGLARTTPLEGEEAAIAREEGARVRRALDQAISTLKPEDQRLLELRLVEGRSLREVASTMGISRQKAGRRCRALTARLRRLLEAQGITAESALGGLDLR